MSMSKRLVFMCVGMRFNAIPIEIMLMLVVGIMGMFMAMPHYFMRMFVFMMFGQMQPYADSHQGGGGPEKRSRRIAQ